MEAVVIDVLDFNTFSFISKKIIPLPINAILLKMIGDEGKLLIQIAIGPVKRSWKNEVEIPLNETNVEKMIEKAAEFGNYFMLNDIFSSKTFETIMPKERIEKSIGAIEYALENRHNHCAEMLLAKGFPLTIECYKIAARTGNVCFIKKRKVFFILPELRESSPSLLDLACESGEIEMVKYLLEDIFQVTTNALLNSFKSNNIELIEYVFDEFKKSPWFYQCDKRGIIRSACWCGSKPLLELLLKKGLKFSQQDVSVCYQRGFRDCYDFLLESGFCYESTLSYIFAREGDKESLEKFLNKGFLPNTTHMQYALESKSIDVVEYLLEKSCPIGSFATTAAAKLGEDLFLKIIQKGAEVTPNASEDIVNMGFYRSIDHLKDINFIDECACNYLFDLTFQKNLKMFYQLLQTDLSWSRKKEFTEFFTPKKRKVEN